METPKTTSGDGPVSLHYTNSVADPDLETFPESIVL